jgi:protein gp37
MMNKQGVNGIEWTHYTWNVIAGCKHACQWQMPDGNIATCYAKTVAERVAQAAYPQGFEEHYWHPKRLNEPFGVKTPSRIFLDSMSDLMGHWVPDNQIEAVLDIARKASHHTFQLLTKNPKRLLDFNFPANVWVGASMPPDFMFGKPLQRAQQERLLSITLETLAKVKAPVRWISAEPLSWNIAPIMAYHAGAIQWCVIGAASNGKTLYAPQDAHIEILVEVLEGQDVTIFYKGNMKASPWALANWRDGFPVTKAMSHVD